MQFEADRVASVQEFERTYLDYVRKNWRGAENSANDEVRDAVLVERERCAKIADNCVTLMGHLVYDNTPAKMGQVIAAKIRENL